MAGLVPPDVVAALRSLRDSYSRHRQAFARQGGAQAAGGLATIDKLLAIVDKAMVSGEAPIHNMTGALRPSPKFLSQPTARLSRGEMVRLLSAGGGTPGTAAGIWWQVRSRAGATGWLERKDLFPDSPAMLTSQPGSGFQAKPLDEIELGVRDTMIR